MRSRFSAHSSQLKRLGFACGVLVLLCVCFACSERVIKEVSTVSLSAQFTHELSTDEENALKSMLGENTQVSFWDLPDEITEEVVNLFGYAPIYFNEDAMLLGFFRSVPAKQAFCDLVDELKTHGWIYIESGSNTSATLVKDVGRFRWIFVTCNFVANETSVVLQLVEQD